MKNWEENLRLRERETGGSFGDGKPYKLWKEEKKERVKLDARDTQNKKSKQEQNPVHGLGKWEKVKPS